jgi:hypothetical protein
MSNVSPLTLQRVLSLLIHLLTNDDKFPFDSIHTTILSLHCCSVGRLLVAFESR